MQPIDPWMKSRVDAARRDLSERAQIQADEIEVVRAERVTWPDGSVGCPRPGMRYTQALVPGCFVQLRAQGRLWNYHGGRGMPHLCNSPSERLPEDVPGADRDL
ncbi:MAG: hypothetical protein M9890_04330 [Thermomicrobiales bacterium]|nr:hypothetical protein [Thermomicrobiales bacterium]